MSCFIFNLVFNFFSFKSLVHTCFNNDSSIFLCQFDWNIRSFCIFTTSIKGCFLSVLLFSVTSSILFVFIILLILRFLRFLLEVSLALSPSINLINFFNKIFTDQLFVFITPCTYKWSNLRKGEFHRFRKRLRWLNRDNNFFNFRFLLNKSLLILLLLSLLVLLIVIMMMFIIMVTVLPIVVILTLLTIIIIMSISLILVIVLLSIIVIVIFISMRLISLILVIILITLISSWLIISILLISMNSLSSLLI